MLCEVARVEAMQRLLSKKEVAAVVGFHPESIMRLVRDGRFPHPIRTGASENCAVRFLESDVEAWIAARMADRPAAPQGA
jgi:predicted DNA-binding transcriptional regulator AlpA